MTQIFSFELRCPTTNVINRHIPSFTIASWIKIKQNKALCNKKRIFLKAPTWMSGTKKKAEVERTVPVSDCVPHLSRRVSNPDQQNPIVTLWNSRRPGRISTSTHTKAWPFLQQIHFSLSVKTCTLPFHSGSCPWIDLIHAIRSLWPL